MIVNHPLYVIDISIIRLLIEGDLMICPKCGKTIKGDAKFCGYCGKKIIASKSVPISSSTTPGKIISSFPESQQVSTAKTSENENNAAKCKYCGSTSLQAMKRGAKVGRAVVGALLVGPLGIAAGGVGMNNIKIVCLNCGKEQN